MAKLKYLGGGFLPKIPARDLTAAEAKKYGLEKLIASGLYEEAYKPKPKKVIEPELVEEKDKED
jgi:hypothetical protein